MNVIFLDIDGVMNSSDFYSRRHRTFKNIIKRYFNTTIRSWVRYIRTGSRHHTSNDWKPNPDMYTFNYTFNRLKSETDPIKWEWLIEFCNRTNTKICISSCWKHHFNKDRNTNSEWWDLALTKLGFNPETFVGITGSRQTLRGDEIKDWIEQNRKFSNENSWWFGDVENYAIIDDDSDMLPEQKDSFFHVDGFYGLSPNTLYRIERHFNKTEDFSNHIKP